MRLNSYCFPDDMVDGVRVHLGASFDGGSCAKGHRCCDDCLSHRDCIDFVSEVYNGVEIGVCANIVFSGVESCLDGLKVSTIKSLIRQHGGTGRTEHIDRDGCVFEVTPIVVGGNNSNHKYNRHL